jgi:diguanylate cyclase (GGDEF)-like protein/PAS domain S-box-containing protein
MARWRFSPIVRISVGLVALTLALILLANLIAAPLQHEDEEVFKQRRALVENLAVQYSKLAENGQESVIRMAMKALVERNSEIASTGLRRGTGELLAQTSDHALNWVKPPGDRSTLSAIQVPIFNGKTRWGSLEVRFAEKEGWLQRWWQIPWVRFLALILCLGYLTYLLFMKKALQYLDPSAVVPERVQTALNALSEGIVLVDTGERIVLANKAFADILGKNSYSLLGTKPSQVNWLLDGENTQKLLPWMITLRTGLVQNGVAVGFEQESGQARKFVVNSSPILDDARRVRGTIASFRDVTELERLNSQLSSTISELESTHYVISEKNQELERLASRDPLSGCLNRRAFFAAAEHVLQQARREGLPLGCIMVDADHFKSYNDRYGHATGDQVIQALAKTLQDGLRSEELLCRYGGEEFCVLAPGVDLELAMRLAERLRKDIEETAGQHVSSIFGLKITASLGVSTLQFGAPDMYALIEQADQALYQAKQDGRNRVRAWSMHRTQGGVRAVS